MTDYLTKLELAALLRVTPRTITNYQQSGRVPPPLKVGRKNLWSRTQLADFIRAQHSGQAAESA